MAELYLAQNNVNKAIVYARNALDFNTKNLNALEVLLVSYRKLANAEMFNQIRNRILEITDLHHFSAIESQLFDQDDFNIKKWDFLTNELPAETILNLALRYLEMNQIPEALSVLQQLPGNTKNKILEAYLLSSDNPERASLILQEVSNNSIELIFPYRKEMLPILEWAHTTNSGWKFTYLLAQNYIAVGQRDRGIELLKGLEMIPNMESFYRFRAKVTDKEAYTDRLTDFRKAIELAPNDWKTWEDAIQFALAQEDNSTALNLSAKAFKKFKSNYSVGLAHAKALLRNNKNTETLKVLRNLQVLPYEHASESKTIYNEAHYGLILENLKSGKLEAALELLNSVRLWPENLGIGKPFESDERLEDFTQALIYTKLGQIENSESALKNILDYRDSNGEVLGTNLAFRLLALQLLNRNSELNSELESYRNIENLNSSSKLGLTLYEKNSKDSMEDFNTNALKLTRFLINQSFN
jgi:predicted Zn-dependent protease